MNHSYWRWCRPRKHEPAASDSTSLSCHAELLGHDSSFLMRPQLRTHQTEGGQEAQLPFHWWKSGLPRVLGQNDENLSFPSAAPLLWPQQPRHVHRESGTDPGFPSGGRKQASSFSTDNFRFFPSQVRRDSRGHVTLRTKRQSTSLSDVYWEIKRSPLQPRQQWQMGICSEIYNSQVPSLQSPLPNTLHMRNENIFQSSSLPRKLIRKNPDETEIVPASLRRCLVHKKCCL